MSETIFDVWRSLHSCIACHPRDWAEGDKRDCWVYGVVCGWDTPYDERPTALKHCSEEDYARMNRYHEILKKAVRDADPKNGLLSLCDD